MAPLALKLVLDILIRGAPPRLGLISWWLVASSAGEQGRLRERVAPADKPLPQSQREERVNRRAQILCLERKVKHQLAATNLLHPDCVLTAEPHN